MLHKLYEARDLSCRRQNDSAALADCFYRHITIISLLNCPNSIPMAVPECSEGLQVVPVPEARPDERAHQHEATLKPFLEHCPVETAQKEPAMILGLRRHHFFLFVAILLFVVVTTVGASVGGVISVRQSKYVLPLRRSYITILKSTAHTDID